MLFILSCGYPDVDTVPDFENIKLTDEELIDLCSTENLSNNDLCKE
tara:strand:+ start:277 stop:414 length:138 start_codon:yes stop_codon:yes gene_type:complete